MKGYIAAGWFTPAQRARLEDIRTVLSVLNIDHYSPMHDNLWEPGMDSRAVFEENIEKIEEANFVIASTEGKDMGTVFECGFAHAVDTPIVYYYTRPGKFNIMLAESAMAVLKNFQELRSYFHVVKTTGIVYEVPYEGGLE